MSFDLGLLGTCQQVFWYVGVVNFHIPISSDLGWGCLVVEDLPSSHKALVSISSTNQQINK
jgi:hypothetical protein